MPPREHGSRTGHVRLLDYNQAIVEGLGAILDETKNQYYVSLTDQFGKGIYIRPPGSDAPVEITKALVVFKESEPTHTRFDVPAFLINLDDISPSTTRIMGVVESYRVPAEGAKPVAIGSQLGWSAYETKPQEWPFDLTYSIECWSRYRTVAHELLQMAMVKYPLYGQLKVYDTLGVERIYHTFQEGSSDLTEVPSVVDRLCGYSLTVRAEVELTNDRVPQTIPAFVGETIPGGGGLPPGGGGSGDPPGSGGIDPGLGGLIGNGQPTTRVTVIGSDE